MNGDKSVVFKEETPRAQHGLIFIFPVANRIR
jgi:hypothetical protein